MDKAVGGCGLIIMVCLGIVWLVIGGGVAWLSDRTEQARDPQGYERRMQFQDRRSQLSRSVSEMTRRCSTVYGDYALLHTPGPALQVEQPTDEEITRESLLSASIRRLGDVRAFAVQYDREIGLLAQMGWPRTSSSEGDRNCDVLSRALSHPPFSELGDDVMIAMAVPRPLLATPITREEAQEEQFRNRVKQSDGQYYLVSNAQ